MTISFSIVVCGHVTRLVSTSKIYCIILISACGHIPSTLAEHVGDLALVCEFCTCPSGSYRSISPSCCMQIRYQCNAPRRFIRLSVQVNLTDFNVASVCAVQKDKEYC